uniref:NADH-ubiquinone oxidoreductase chain 6 n=1 Tax=Harpiocephalus harpia TaxID=124749 RepID=A0A890JIQ1_HARHA|nr:NADH dehydrogenase subunit 6 [Harpiocephalus harpia]
MIYIVFILSIIFVIGFVGFSSKPSPVFGGIGLILGGGFGCGIVVSFGGSFLGLMVFLIYLGGMLVVFGYTTAMAMDQYPESWVSNLMVLGSFIFGLFVEFLLILCVLVGEELEVVYEFNEAGDWIFCNMGDSEVFSEEITGVSALYSFGNWLVFATGWSLFMGVVIVLEIIRGN